MTASGPPASPPSPSPVLHLLAGSNGAGKSTLAERVLQPVTGLPFVNADRIAAEHWSEDPEGHAYDAAALADEERRRLMDERASFIAETVFSHRSKVELVQDAVSAGYVVYLHVVLIPEDTSVRRVESRVVLGGHSVPETKVRGRYSRLWALVAEARNTATHTIVYDNSRAKDPFRKVATFNNGVLVGTADWPVWTPLELI